MSSTTTDAAPAGWEPGSPLLGRLVDDAAVFPPAATPLPDAVRLHRGHRASAWAPAIGPLLVPASGVADLEAVLDAEGAPARAECLEVVLVVRPGGDPALITAAVDALHDEPRLLVVGAELGWQPDWRDHGLDALALALEVPRGEQHRAALDDVRDARREGRRVVAKLRTGPTPTWPWPDEAEVADFLVATASLEVPFKLTGGLHHAVRGAYEVDGVAEENHGVLNVLVATSAALAGGTHDEVAGLLGVRDAGALAALVTAWPDDTAARVRQAFTAYGCCTVTDPLGELSALGVLSA